jgi:serine phosphatase RsbU (regulator of sigma subunit)
VRVLIVVLAALAVFALWLTVEGSGGAGIAFLYVVPVALAAWWYGRRAGLATVVVCTVLYLVSVAIDPVDDVVVSALVRVAAMVATAVVVAELRRRTAMLADTTRELSAIRDALTPAAMPKLPGLDVAVQYIPAERGVSGDFYLLTNGPTVSIAMVGDVCGHGPAAAQRATFARATLASVAASCDDPGEILDLVNRTLAERWTSGEFLTVTCIAHDAIAGTVRWATAGHPPPIRLSDLTELDGRAGVPLGIDGDGTFVTHEGALHPRDGVLLYTDGVLDARAGAVRFGEERLRALLAECSGAPAAEIVDRLARAVGEFAGRRLPDDVCILALRSVPDEVSPRPSTA